ncbi:MAG TPA: hypothetical protein VGO96_18505, partial [Pyrinomonadaceae bacterium]|nr:hypothetical protein [Pyrinomonadaceae bacterium]
MELLRGLHRGGATICMVTHDPRYAQHADRIVRLLDGRIVEQGEPDREHELMAVGQPLRQGDLEKV